MDLSPRDYRAWYGLGQTYELLHMPFYALHYFRRATQVGLLGKPGFGANLRRSLHVHPMHHMPSRSRLAGIN